MHLMPIQSTLLCIMYALNTVNVLCVYSTEEGPFSVVHAYILTQLGNTVIFTRTRMVQCQLAVGRDGWDTRRVVHTHLLTPVAPLGRSNL